MNSSETQKKILAAAIARRNKLALQECFDPANPESRPTGPQLEVFREFGKIPKQWIVASNQSGKTATCIRNLSWFITDTHPFWSRPPEWKNQDLLALVFGRTGKQIEEIALRLVKFFEAGTYKEVRTGNAIQRIELTNGNRIIFQSLENPGQARERAQGFVSNFVWIDEMPQTVAIIDEAMRRVQAKNGYFMTSFTPLVVNADIKNMVEAAQLPYGKKYVFKMFDNPTYADPARQEEILDSMKTLPESVRRCRLYGEWASSENAVYQWIPELMERPLPDTYSPAWRHVESTDPAIESALGFCLLAENPADGCWYLVKSMYIKGIYIPEKILEEVQKHTKGYNIVRRIADGAATWYIRMASQQGITYVTPWGKNNVGRKDELIKNLQQKLGTKLFIPAWNKECQDELISCHWSETAEGKIVKGSRFHILDCLQYFCDLIPKFEGIDTPMNWQHETILYNNQLQAMEASAMEKPAGPGRQAKTWGQQRAERTKQSPVISVFRMRRKKW